MKRFVTNVFIVFALFFAICIAVRLYPHEKLSHGVPVSVAVYADKGELLRLFLASDGHYRLWIPLEAMPDNLKEATLLYEDNWFYYHPGFNPISLGRALWQTYISGGARQGASTITMQLARLRYKLNTKSIGGKLRQILKAVELELCYSKDEILEAYLNIAPYGRNIEGVGAASLIYFSKSTKDLNLPETLSLAVLPQAPTQRMREGTNFARKSQVLLNKSLNDARARLFAAWQQKHKEAASESAVFALPLSINAPEQLAFLAPHFTQQIYDEQMLKGQLPHSIKSTLNLHLQKLLEQRMSSFLQGSARRGLNNAAAILVDYRTMQVKALVGSGNYFNEDISGQINGTNINRSPGSTLKPFIYALGLDQGIITPRTMLKDVPTAFGPYTPSNFDQKFLGPISAEEALIRSRNIPAVYVGSQLKNPSLYEFLRSASLSHLAAEGKYGLALMLGGGDISMQELALLYCILANNGAYYPLQFSGGEAKPAARQLLSPESSFITLDMLSHAPRPTDTAEQGEKISVAWKTGTSWGFRDAWCAGVFGPYVLVVWLGNFDNSSNEGLVGVEAAAPLFFGVIDAVMAEHSATAVNRLVPEGVKKVSVCLASGSLPTVWCHNVIDTWYIPEKSPIKVDTIHRPVYFSKKTGEVACPPYDMEDTTVKVYEFWPSDLATAFKKAGLPRVVPPQNPLCKNARAATIPPKIASPLKNVSYIKYKKGESDRIPLKATTDAEVDRIYWFVDTSYLATVKPGEDIFWTPEKPGKYSLTVVDDHGNSETRNIDVLEGVSF